MKIEDLPVHSVMLQTAKARINWLIRRRPSVRCLIIKSTSQDVLPKSYLIAKVLAESFFTVMSQLTGAVAWLFNYAFCGLCSVLWIAENSIKVCLCPCNQLSASTFVCVYLSIYLWTGGKDTSAYFSLFFSTAKL